MCSISVVSLGCICSWATIMGRASPTRKVLVSGQKLIHLSDGNIITEDACNLVNLMQYVKFMKYGDVYFEIINKKRCCGLLAGELVIICFCMKL